MLNEITSWLCIAILSMFGSLLYVPWRVEDDRWLWKHLGFAPLWSHRFDRVPGAKVDQPMVAFVLLIIAILSAAISYVAIA